MAFKPAYATSQMLDWRSARSTNEFLQAVAQGGRNRRDAFGIDFPETVKPTEFG